MLIRFPHLGGLLLSVLAGSAMGQQFVAELDAGPGTTLDSSSQSVVAGNGVVYFLANIPGYGTEPCVSDGTVAGTRVFLDFTTGPRGNGARPFGAVAAGLLLETSSGTLVTDGTQSGTRLLRAYRNGSGDYGAPLVFDLGPRFVWVEKFPLYPTWTLYGSDGTAAGTVTVSDQLAVYGAVVRNGVLLVAADAGAGALQLYSTDGITITAIATLPRAGRSGFASLGAHDYFVVEDPSSQSTLWRTDGTTSGTTFVAHLGPQQSECAITRLGSQLLIGAGNQLWVSDGTGPGTAPLSVSVGAVNSLTLAGNVAVFTAAAAGGQKRLWRTDGTVSGTYVLDNAPAAYRDFVSAGANVFGLVGQFSPLQIVRTDGTAGGTVRMPTVAHGIYPTLVPLGNDVITTLTPGNQGAVTTAHVYRTNGTQTGTVRLTPSTEPVGIRWSSRGAAVDSTLFFPANTLASGTAEWLWRTDGTAAGTQLVPGTTANVSNVKAFQGAVWFASGSAIWRHDGGPGASVLTLQPDSTAFRAQLLEAKDGYLVFSTTSTSAGMRAWRSDGTVAGTRLLYVGASDEAVLSVVQMGDTTFTLQGTSNSAFGTIVRSDGTAAGTTNFGLTGRWMDRLGDLVYFVRPVSTVLALRYVSATGPEINVIRISVVPNQSFPLGSRFVCFTNGSAYSLDGAGTVTALPFPPRVDSAFAADGFVYATSLDADFKLSLWRTDGSVAGTVPTITFAPNLLGNLSAAEPLGSGNRLFLNASNGVSGSEPWISQGTQATTTLLADLVPNGNSSPKLVGIAGARAFFAAFDPVRGRELWSFELAAVGVANAQPFGVGCSGSNGIPRLAVEGMPAIGRTLSLRLQRGAASSLGLWFLGLGPQRLPVGGGCEFLMTTVAWAGWAITDATGAASTSLAVPSDPVFVGLQVVAQAACLDALAPAGLGITGSEGVLLMLGG